MAVKFSKTLSFIVPVLAGAFLTACFSEQAVTGDGKSVTISKGSGDPRIEFLVEEGVQRELISVVYDSVSRDSGYIIEPPITPEQKRRGMRGTGVGFKAKEIDKLISVKATNAGADPELKPTTTSGGLLSKKAHTRWDHWTAPFDVKKVNEVNRIRVYIYTAGPARLGPNWTGAVRSAISNWNAQAKGSAVTFVETTNATDHDLSFRGSFGIGNDGSLTSSAFLTADQYIYPDGISLWVNTGYEHSGVPHNQKTTVAMSLLALSTNITFTGMEGYYWNNGASIYIPGTPATEGDGLTAGSSILTYGTSGVSTPVMTAGDLKTFRTVYPTFGSAALIHDRRIYVNSTTRTQPVKVDEAYVMAYQVASDTLIYSRRDGKLMRRIGNEPAVNVQIWPGAGSSGNVSEFLYSKGHYAVRTTNGKLFTKTPTSNWVAQSPSFTFAPGDMRLDKDRLTVAVPARTQLLAYHFGNTTTPVNPVLDWDSPAGTLSDWKINNGLLTVVDNGVVWAMQNYTGWSVIYDGSSGPANTIQLSDELMAINYTPIGSSNSALAIRHGGISGWWSFYTDPMYSAKDYDLCGDKVAFLQESRYLRVIDYSTWTVYEHYSLPRTNYVKAAQLSGPNCDFITIIRDDMQYAKYGIDLDNQYSYYLGVTTYLRQKDVPIYNP